MFYQRGIKIYQSTDKPGMSLKIHSKVLFFFWKQSENLKQSPSFKDFHTKWKHLFPGHVSYATKGVLKWLFIYLTVPEEEDGGGLRLDWLPLGIKAATKGLYFVQVEVHVSSLMSVLV